MTDDQRKEKLREAIQLLERAQDLLNEAYRSHLKTSYMLKFDNLVDKNGDMIEIDLGDEYKPICVELMHAGRAGRASAESFKRMMSDEQARNY